MKALLPCLLLTASLAAGLWWSALLPNALLPWSTSTPDPAPTTIPPAAALVAMPPPPSPAPAAVPEQVQPPLPTRLPLEVEVARSLRSGSAADRDRALHVLLPELVARDPALAGHLALAWEPGAVRDELLRQFIRQWAATDIGGVITWITSLLDETDRQNAATALTAQVAQDDPAGAIELAQLLHVGVDDGSLEHRVQLWTEEKPAEALDWIVRRPADAQRDRLLARIAWTRAQREPAEAAGLVLNHMTPGDARDEALMGVVRQWAVRDPAPATAWVASFPAGPLHTRALAELATADRLR